MKHLEEAIQHLNKASKSLRAAAVGLTTSDGNIEHAQRALQNVTKVDESRGHVEQLLKRVTEPPKS